MTCISFYILTSVQINHEKCLIGFRHWNTCIKAGTTCSIAEIARITSGILLVSDPECLHHTWNSICTAPCYVLCFHLCRAVNNIELFVSTISQKYTCNSWKNSHKYPILTQSQSIFYMQTNLYDDWSLCPIWTKSNSSLLYH